jgi:hypothetical protein
MLVLVQAMTLDLACVNTARGDDPPLPAEAFSKVPQEPRETRYSLQPPDPLTTEMEVTSINALERGSWRAESRTRTLIRCTAEEFLLDLDLNA